jgi:hypothetical protein
VKLSIKNITNEKLGPLKFPLNGMVLEPGEIKVEKAEMTPKEFFNSYIGEMIRGFKLAIGRLE